MTDKKVINILHLYPDLLNLYGDKGNISSLAMRLKWRGIDANVVTCTKGGEISLDDVDIVFLGGGSDKEQTIVANFLNDKRDEFKEYIEEGGVLLATCGGFEMLGKYFETSDGRVEGLGVLDFYTEFSGKRLISNVVIDSPLCSQKIIGFENHAGRTKIGDCVPLGRVLCGNGNDGESGYEGIIYKNVIATHLHGPLLPKNPMLCDYILSCVMSKKYENFEGLEAIDDTLENAANEYMADKLIND